VEAGAFGQFLGVGNLECPDSVPAVWAWSGMGMEIMRGRFLQFQASQKVETPFARESVRKVWPEAAESC
jgi:hypothetical protein